MRIHETRGESGFSLVELMIAMVVTVIVTGSVVGLITSGKGSFRREPELTDRQQNIRIAMDVIQRDIATAGMDLPPGVQAFVNNLNNPAGAPNSPLGGGAPGGPRTDYLEMVGNDGACPSVSICESPGVVVRTNESIPNCYRLPATVVVIPGKLGAPYSLGFAWNPGPSGSGCAGTQVNFPPGQGPPEWNPPGGFPAPATLARALIVRYQIAPDSAGVPGLWRSESGGRDQAGNFFNPPNPAGNWQMIARAIEDLQVEYRIPDLAALPNQVWQDVPGNVICNAPCSSNNNVNYNTIVREVRVTLSARAEGALLTGQSAGGPLGAAVRGRLTSVTVPRAAMFHLSQAPGGPLWR